MEFLEFDMEKAVKEAKSFEDCMYMATYHGYQKNYKEVATYLECAARSVRELEKLKQRKREFEQAASILSQIAWR